MTSWQRVYEVRPRKDHRGIDLISDALPFGRLWYGEPNAISNAIDYARFYSRSHDAVIRVYDEAGNLKFVYGDGNVSRLQSESALAVMEAILFKIQIT